MAIRGAKLAVAICAGIAASFLLTLLPHVAAAAAEDCVTEPTKTAEGQHWYYRFDRGTNRRCWYLKDSADKQPQQPSSSWDFALPTAPKFVPRRPDSTASRASTDMSADTPSPRARTDGDVSVPPKPPFLNTPNADRSAPDNAPDQGLTRELGGFSQPLDTSAADPAPASAASTSEDPTLQPDANAAPATTDASDAVQSKATKPVAPIHKLLMVMVGALALSGLLASGLYRLSKVGRRRRRDANWQRAAARARRMRAKPRTKTKVDIVGSRNSVSAGRAAAARNTSPPAAAEITRAKVVDVKKGGVHEPRFVEPNPPPAKIVATRSANPVTGASDIVRPAAVGPATGLINRPEGRPARPVARPANADAVRQASPTPGTDNTPAKVTDPAAELVHLLESRGAKPASRRAKIAATRGASPPAPPVDAVAPMAVNPDVEPFGYDEAPVPEPAPRPVRTAATRSVNPADVAPAQAVHPAADVPDHLDPLPERTLRPAAAAAGHNTNPPVAAANIAAAKPVDPTDELVEYLEARAAQHAGQPAHVAAPPSANPQPMPALVAASNPVDPAQGLADYLESQVARPAPVARPAAIAKPATVAKPATTAKPAVRPAKVAKARSGNRPPAREAGLPKTVDPVAQPAGQLQPRTAKKPAARPAPVAASRPAEPAPRPFPPDISNPDDDSATPPLDFIPRPHALRPHMRNVGQDESLDGIEDILARLGRHAKA